ncbi:MAG: hypothetical protein WCQ32_02145 [bacterium]
MTNIESFDQDLDKIVERADFLSMVWDNLEKGEPAPIFSGDAADALFYAEKLELLMDYNQEENQHDEGVVFYAQVQAYIDNLRKIK